MDFAEVIAGSAREDAEFIAHTREDIPWLLEQVEWHKKHAKMFAQAADTEKREAAYWRMKAQGKNE